MPKKTVKSPKKTRSSGLPKAPKPYRKFIVRYPELASAWESISKAGADGPLDLRTRRLVRLAAAMGAMREGAVRAGARKALAEGVSLEEIEQLIPLVAGTLGMPSAVACWSWICDALDAD
jgi:alkylhydroperoxidase/carboxymuconolactone decarboxylase family protein YurZ